MARLSVGDGLRVGSGLLFGRRVACGERVGDGLVGAAVRVVDAERVERLEERVLRAREGDTVLGAPRAGERRLDGGEIELDDLRVRRMLFRQVPEHVLLAVGLDERDALLRTAG